MKIDNYYVIEYDFNLGNYYKRIKSIGKVKFSSVFDFNSDTFYSYYISGYKDIIFKKFLKDSKCIDSYPLSCSEFLTNEEHSTKNINRSRMLEIFLLLNKNNVNEKVSEEKQKKLTL